MPITYGGIDLTPPAYALAEVERWWHYHRIRESDHPAYFTSGLDHLPHPYPPSREPPRIGVLHWPNTASRWATCHVLATGDQLARVQAVAGSSLDLVLSDGTRSVTTPMYRLPARPVSQRGDGRELYLLTLVDERYYWWMAGDQRAPLNPSSWSNLLTSLFTSIGVTTTLDAVAAGYSVPSPGRWAVGYKPLPLLIDAACRAVGLRVVRSLAGAVSCVTYATAAASDSAQWTTYQYECLAGGRATSAEVGRSVPASCTVVFTGPAPVVTTNTLAALALTAYGSATGTAGKIGQVVADIPASASAGDRTSYATIAATDFYHWQLSLTDATFRAVQGWTPTGLEACCEWVMGADDIVTRVIRAPNHDPNVYGEHLGGSGGGGFPHSDDIVNGDPATRQYQYAGPNDTGTSAPVFFQEVSKDGSGPTSPPSPKFFQAYYSDGPTGASGFYQQVTAASTGVAQQFQQGYTLAAASGYYTVLRNASGVIQYQMGNSAGTSGFFQAPTIASGNVTQFIQSYALWNGTSVIQKDVTATVSGSTITVAYPAGMIIDFSLASVILPTIVGETKWVKVTKTFTQLAAAATTNRVVLRSLGQYETFEGYVMKHSIAFTGGALASYGALLFFASNPVSGTGLAMLPAPANTSFGKGGGLGNDPYWLKQSFAAQDVEIEVNSTGANLDAATQGSVDIWLKIGNLPP